MIELNGVKWEPVEGVKYYRKYEKAYRRIQEENNFDYERAVFRKLILEDLWFLVYFVLGVSVANHKFWVDACREVQDGPKNRTLDIWARDHGKSTIITTAQSIRQVLLSKIQDKKDERIAIISYSRATALVFLRQIKYILETNKVLKLCFPDVLYMDPSKEAYKWSEENGLYLQRLGSHKEATFEAWGLIEGMPTGRHFSGRIYDDISTYDLAQTPEMIEKVKDTFDMSHNIGTKDGWHRVIGTIYHHNDCIVYCMSKKKSDGSPMYTTRLKPATEDGTVMGKSVYLPEEKLDELRTNLRHFATQQLCDPTPLGEGALDASMLKQIEVDEIPKNLFKFMIIDPAGVDKNRPGDSWALGVFGVEPYRDEIGASWVYILDLVIAEMSHPEAMEEIVKMYMRNGRILKLGVEKVGISTTEIHVANALRAKGKAITVGNGRIKVLKPSGRKKSFRIESSLSWPLANGKIKVSKAVSPVYYKRLQTEMEKFPAWHDDGLDICAYLYDIIGEYRFGERPVDEKQDAWAMEWNRDKSYENGWMVQ